MFGYVVPDKPELKIKEFELFRAYYCGVCKSMGRSFGSMSRLALNYDSVFLGLMLSALSKETPTLNKEACIANPFKRKWVVKNNKYVDFVADINVIFTYYKLKDNWNDEHSFNSLMASKLFYRGFKKAKNKNPEVHSLIYKSIEELSALEKSSCASMDRAAEPFADMLGNVLSIGFNDAESTASKAIKWLGYNLGKWIYTIDAYDDIEKDSETKSYNPLILQYKYDDEESIHDFKCRIKEEVRFNLVHALGQVANTIELLDASSKGILENIAYLGMYKKTEQILGDCVKCNSPINNKNITEGVKA